MREEHHTHERPHFLQPIEISRQRCGQRNRCYPGSPSNHREYPQTPLTGKKQQAGIAQGSERVHIAQQVLVPPLVRQRPHNQYTNGVHGAEDPKGRCGCARRKPAFHCVGDKVECHDQRGEPAHKIRPTQLPHRQRPKSMSPLLHFQWARSPFWGLGGAIGRCNITVREQAQLCGIVLEHQKGHRENQQQDHSSHDHPCETPVNKNNQVGGEGDQDQPTH